MWSVPSAKPRLGLGDDFGADQAGGLCDVDRRAGKALGEGREVLSGEEGSRHDDGDLLAGNCRDEGGAERDLGLAEPDVAADQPVHRAAGSEIIEHAACGVLILGLAGAAGG